MAGQTGPVPVYRYGAEQNAPTSWGVGATQTLYYGEVALMSGSGSVTTGFIKNAATAGASDVVVGMIDAPAGGTYVETGSGIVGGSTDGAVWVDIKTGAFLFQSGTGSDLLSATTNGATVYYGGENASGPIACATQGTPHRPILGVQLPQDPGFANGFGPGSNYWPVVLNQVPKP
jgi:hypothetical protein